MRSYGDKPQWFMQLVPGGMLPVIKLDGEIITESLTGDRSTLLLQRLRSL